MSQPRKGCDPFGVAANVSFFPRLARWRAQAWAEGLNAFGVMNESLISQVCNYRLTAFEKPLKTVPDTTTWLLAISLKRGVNENAMLFSSTQANAKAIKKPAMLTAMNN